MSKKYLQLSRITLQQKNHLSSSYYYECGNCFDNINGPHPTQSEEAIIKFSFISKKKNLKNNFKIFIKRKKEEKKSNSKIIQNDV